MSLPTRRGFLKAGTAAFVGAAGADMAKGEVRNSAAQTRLETIRRDHPETSCRHRRAGKLPLPPSTSTGPLRSRCHHARLARQ